MTSSCRQWLIASLALLRASDTVGRLGGDEFVILADGGSLGPAPEAVAERVREVLRTPFHVDGFEGLPVTVTASIGIATGTRSTAQELLRDADIALYRAKASGGTVASLFETAMQSAALDRLELKSDLDSALADDQFFLLYQPIFDLDNEHHPGGGSPHPLAASDPGRHPPRRLHPGPRGQRDDRRCRPLGPG